VLADRSDFSHTATARRARSEALEPAPPTRRERVAPPVGALPAWGAPGGLIGQIRAELVSRAFASIERAWAKVKGECAR
jgi:hypothetical protein